MRRGPNLVRTGYDPHYGARPLKRAIQKEMETPLARRILAGEIRDGAALVVDNGGAAEGLQFNVKSEKKPAAARK